MCQADNACSQVKLNPTNRKARQHVPPDVLQEKVHVCVCVSVLSRVQLFVTPRTVAHQAPLSMGLSRQECWSGLPFTPPEDVPDPGIEPTSPAL